LGLTNRFRAGSVLQIEPDVLNRATGFKQVPTIQNPNVLVQSWTIESAKRIVLDAVKEFLLENKECYL